MQQLDLGHIFVIEDDPEVSLLLSDLLRDENFQVTCTESLEGAREFLQRDSADLVLLDLNLVDGSGVDLIPEMVEQPAAPAVLVLTANTSPGTAADCIRKGAFDYITKPFDIETLLNRIRHALRVRRNRIDDAARSRGSLIELSQQTIPLPSPAMREVEELVVRLGRQGAAPVLIHGESGVGKGHIARKIHELSPRFEGPFVAVNCANFDKNLILSELFGHEKGAFTGANERRVGLFELTSHGTLFLDEVGELPGEVQAQFLRVLENGSLRRLGGVTEIPVNTRVIAATNKDLRHAMGNGSFRPDLYYRLNVAEILVPPLRERREDIEVLARHFCLSASRHANTRMTITPGAISLLASYHWPGNVRELRNVIERAEILTRDGVIGRDILQPFLPAAPPGLRASAPKSDLPADATLASVQAAHIQRVLKYCNGNQSKAAQILDISPRTLSRKLAKMREAQS